MLVVEEGIPTQGWVEAEDPVQCVTAWEDIQAIAILVKDIAQKKTSDLSSKN